MSEFYKELRVDNGLRKIGVNDQRRLSGNFHQ